MQFHVNRPQGSVLIHEEGRTDGRIGRRIDIQTDGHDEGNRRFLQQCDRAY
jgi:hypothetical protein